MTLVGGMNKIRSFVGNLSPNGLSPLLCKVSQLLPKISVSKPNANYLQFFNTKIILQKFDPHSPLKYFIIVA